MTHTQRYWSRCQDKSGRRAWSGTWSYTGLASLGMSRFLGRAYSGPHTHKPSGTAPGCKTWIEYFKHLEANK